MVGLRGRYANALLELSEEKGTLEKDLEQVILIRDTLDTSETQAFLIHPHIPDSAKHQLFDTAFPDTIHKHLKGFLYLMVRKNRETLIVPALTDFIEAANKRLGKIEAKVVSAKTLTDTQLENIRNILSRKIGMQVKIKATIDPDVIGGFYILVDGLIYDGTVRSKLNIMRERLKRGDINVS